MLTDKICLKIEIDYASFAFRERLFQSLAPLYLKLFFRNSFLGLGRAISVYIGTPRIVARRHRIAPTNDCFKFGAV